MSTRQRAGLAMSPTKTASFAMKSRQQTSIAMMHRKNSKHRQDVSQKQASLAMRSRDNNKPTKTETDIDSSTDLPKQSLNMGLDTARVVSRQIAHVSVMYCTLPVLADSQRFKSSRGLLESPAAKAAAERDKDRKKLVVHATEENLTSHCLTRATCIQLAVFSGQVTLSSCNDSK